MDATEPTLAELNQIRADLARERTELDALRIDPIPGLASFSGGFSLSATPDDVLILYVPDAMQDSDAEKFKKRLNDGITAAGRKVGSIVTLPNSVSLQTLTIQPAGD